MLQSDTISSPNDKVNTDHLLQDTINFVTSDNKVITHPQQKIFTAVKSVPSSISAEENKRENFAFDCLSGNRKRKVASKYNKNHNKNTKSQE